MTHENQEVQLRPMLAAKFDEARTLKHIQEDGYLLAQPKIDGMRVLHYNGEPKSRSWKTWTNIGIQAWSSHTILHGLDGELLPGRLSEQDPTSFRRAQSELRAEDGGQVFTYYVFDNFLEPAIAYESRLERLRQRFASGAIPLAMAGQFFHVDMVLCPTIGFHKLEELYEYEEGWLKQGFEGAILRRRLSPYKYNRATAREGWLTKLKRFEDAEAEIIGVEPRYKNNNGPTINELGLTSRSAHQENLEAQESVGAFRVRLLHDGNASTSTPVEFNIGVFRGYGLSDREAMWRQRDHLVGRIVTFKHQGYSGGYDVPRTPVMVGFRDPIEL